MKWEKSEDLDATRSAAPREWSGAGTSDSAMGTGSCPQLRLTPRRHSPFVMRRFSTTKSRVTLKVTTTG
jgi:hypothetical protein